jgi:hypothetical protein
MKKGIWILFLVLACYTQKSKSETDESQLEIAEMAAPEELTLGHSVSMTMKLLSTDSEDLSYITEAYLEKDGQLVLPNEADNGDRYGYGLAVQYSEIWKDHVYVVTSGVPRGALKPNESCGSGNTVVFPFKHWDHYNTDHYCEVPGQPNVHKRVIRFRPK